VFTQQNGLNEKSLRVGCRVAEQQDSVATVLAITNFISLFFYFVFYFFLFYFFSIRFFGSSPLPDTSEGHLG